MVKVEDLQGIHGDFEGMVKRHPDPKLTMRGVADGALTYERNVDGEGQEVTIKVQGVSVRRLHGPDVHDIRRYIRVKRGPKGNRDKIIGLVDKD